MFGLTRREQRWKAEQKAAELLVGFAQAVVEVSAKVRIAEAEAEAECLRKEVAELRAAAGVDAPPAVQPVGWQWLMAGGRWGFCESERMARACAEAGGTTWRPVYAGPCADGVGGTDGR